MPSSHDTAAHVMQHPRANERKVFISTAYCSLHLGTQESLVVNLPHVSTTLWNRVPVLMVSMSPRRDKNHAVVEQQTRAMHQSTQYTVVEWQLTGGTSPAVVAWHIGLRASGFLHPIEKALGQHEV